MTDIVTLLLSIYFVIEGASRGFLNSLIFPSSIILATIISFIYYQVTNDMLISLLIGLIFPFLLDLLLRFLIKILAKVSNRDIKPGYLSRFGGSMVALTWGWLFISITLILLAVLPPWGRKLTFVHNDVVKSASYFLVAKPLGDVFFDTSKQNNTPDTAVAANNEATSLAQDPRFQKVLEDPDIQKDIDDHDIAKLISNPKMMDLVHQIMSDPVTMKKIMTVYSTQASAASKYSFNPQPDRAF